MKIIETELIYVRESTYSVDRRYTKIQTTCVQNIVKISTGIQIPGLFPKLNPDVLKCPRISPNTKRLHIFLSRHRLFFCPDILIRKAYFSIKTDFSIQNFILCNSHIFSLKRITHPNVL